MDKKARSKKHVPNGLTSPTQLSQPDEPLPVPEADKVLRKDLNAQIVDLLRQSKEDGANCDITIEIGGQQFKAHMSVLSSLSPYFKVLFLSEGFKEMNGIVKIYDVSADTFGLLLDFMYGDSDVYQTNDEDILVEAMRAADIFQLTIFKSECMHWVRSNQQQELGKCFALLTASGIDQSDEAGLLMDQVCKFFTEDKPPSLDFKYISLELMKSCLYRYNLNPKARIEKKLRFIFQWMIANSDAETFDINSLIEIVSITDYAMKELGIILARSTEFMQEIPESIQIALSELFNEYYYVRYRVVTPPPKINLWTVEYSKNVVSIKEYDFTKKYYKKSDNILGMTVCNFCVSNRMIHLFDQSGMMSYNTDDNSFARDKLYLNLDMFKIIQTFSRGSDVYVLCCFRRHSTKFKVMIFDLLNQTFISTAVVELTDNGFTEDGRRTGRHLFFSTGGEVYVMIQNACFLINAKGMELTRVLLDCVSDQVLLSNAFWNPSDLDQVDDGCIYSVFSDAPTEHAWMALWNELNQWDIQLVKVNRIIDADSGVARLKFVAYDYIPLGLDDKGWSIFGVNLSAIISG